MTRIDSFIYLLTRCVVVINDGLIVLNPFFMANLFIHLHNHPYVQGLFQIVKLICLIFASFLVIIASISYGFVRTKQTYMQDASPVPRDNEYIDVIEQEQREITKICECPKKLSRQLICYCDGSYSCETQIGYSGFRTSNGFSKYRRCPLRRSYSGSTESEVFAACLALQYTAKYQYDTLTLYTDNSKVKQILTQPKGKDHNNYPTLFKALRQCHKGSEQFRIRVEHVRGHTTWYEQQQCPIKREFAKVDRQVRRRRQQYETHLQYPN